ncbi:hypothetical protein STENM223S_02359 [Streptomyces tendae]
MEKAFGSWPTELHVASAEGFGPPGQALSRVADHMDSPPRPLDFANSTSCAASSTPKTSEATSLTPIIGVTATVCQASASDSPRTPLIWAWVAVAAWVAYVPMSSLYAGP